MPHCTEMSEEYPVVSEAEWVQARLELLKEEQNHREATHALAAKRREMPWRKIEKDYIFDGGPLGQKTLAEMFGKADTLFVYHLMYSSGDERACPRCTSLLDQFQSLKLHVQAEGLMTFVVIAKGSYETLMPTIASNNWIWDVYSAAGNTFPEDHGTSKGGGLEGVEGKYAYIQDWPGGADGPPNLPGISIFKLGDDGEVYHTYSAFGPELLELVQYNFMFDLTSKGRPEGTPPMSFLKHKDTYPYPGGIYPKD